jgi:hypothetical protein
MALTDKLPTGKTPARTDAPATLPDATPAAPAENGRALMFDDIAEIPGSTQRAALTNPFQEKVNALAKNGGASSVVVSDDDVKWVRDMIRRATGAIGKGAVTKVTPATENPDGTGKKIPGKSRVYFSVGNKRTRNAS